MHNYGHKSTGKLRFSTRYILLTLSFAAFPLLQNVSLYMWIGNLPIDDWLLGILISRLRLHSLDWPSFLLKISLLVLILLAE